MTYEEAYDDRRYLWETYGQPYDWTGGYVAEEDLESLLKKPSKTTARRLLFNQIQYWFEVGPDILGTPHNGSIPWEDPTVCDIAERHGISYG